MTHVLIDGERCRSMLQEDICQPYTKQPEFRDLTRDLGGDEVAPPTRSRDGDCPLRPAGSPRLDLQGACIYGTDEDKERARNEGGKEARICL